MTGFQTCALPICDFCAIIGPRGSGKSTLLHLSAGLESPTAGEIEVSGKKIAALSDYELTLFRRRNIGLVFQAYNLIPTLTMEENVMLPLLADGAVNDASLKRIDELLELLKISDLKGRYPDAMSGGEQQRTAIARALSTNPDVLFADEPTGNLDSENSRIICERLKALCETQSRTIIMVTHEPIIAAWAKRVVVLQDGRITGSIDTNDSQSVRTLTDEYYNLLTRSRSSGAQA